MKREKIESCALCGSKSILKKSHIIPKFVGSYLKKTSPISRMRCKNNPNKPIQDIEKEFLLCDECEQRFSKYEKRFSERIFKPFVEGGIKKFTYDSDLYYFIVSVNWRRLILSIRSLADEYCDKDMEHLLNSSEKKLRLYLLGKEAHTHPIRHYIYFVDKKWLHLSGERHLTLSYKHLTRSIGGDTFYNEKYNAIYIVDNMMGVFIITLLDYNENDLCEKMEVLECGGELSISEQNITDFFIELLHDFEVDGEDIFNRMSDNQKEKINEKLLEVIGYDADNYDV